MAEKAMLNGGWQPLEPYQGALTPWKSKCLKCGSVGTPQFSNVQRGSGCIKCKNEEKINPKKYTEEQAIEIMLDSGLKPLESYKNSKSPWKSQCLNCNRVVSPTLGNVKNTKIPCVFCSGHKVDELDAIRVMEAADLIPLEPFKDGSSRWKSKCKKCGEIVFPVYAWVRGGQGGCISCGREATASSHRYSHDATVLIMREAGLEPLEGYKKSDTAWKCKCLKCGKIVFPSYSNVRNGHSGCAYCSGNAIDPLDAERIMLESGYEPLEPYSGSNKKKWKARHTQCGNIVYPAYNTIQNRKSGCSTCAEFGLKLEEPSYVYIMFHGEFRSIKVGISNNKAIPNRIKSHASDGWELHRQIDVENGAIATQIESEVFNWIRNEKKLGVHLSKEMMKHHGYSETVDAEEITILEIEKHIKSIMKRLGI